MSPTLTLFAALTITLTTLVALYAVSVRQVARHITPFPRAALVPFITPVYTWRGGARALTLVTIATGALYVLLWVAASVGGVW